MFFTTQHFIIERFYCSGKRAFIICIQDKKEKEVWGELNIAFTGTYAI